MERLLTLVSVFACGCAFDASGFAGPDRADAGPRPDAGLPPRGYQPTDQGGLYRAIDTPGSAALAAMACGADAEGAHLTVIDDARENGAVRRLADEQLGGARIWLGVSDQLDEGTWLSSVAARPVGYTSWKQDEPNDWDGEDCAVMLGADDPPEQRARWNDVDCDEAHVFLCEWDPER